MNLIDVLYYVLIGVIVLVALVLVLMILIQSDKGGGLAASMGGMGAGAQSLLGGKDAAPFLTKWTRNIGIAFLVLCTIIGILGRARVNTGYTSKSLMQKKVETDSRQRSLGTMLPSINNAPMAPAATAEPAAPAPGGAAEPAPQAPIQIPGVTSEKPAE
jgi:preprotein translocase subunit SecG